MLVIKNGKLLTITNGIIENGAILIENGKIKEIGKNVTIPKNAKVIDASGKYVLPGLIDAHTNIGLKEGGIRWEGADHIEQTEAVVPQLRPVDGFNPLDVALKEAREAGVTVSNVTPGDVNVFGGIGSAFKLAGYLADEMYITDTCVKVALGENAKNIFGGKKIPSTRMGTAALLRENLLKASNYLKKLKKGKEDDSKMPKRDLKMEALVRVIKKEIPLHIHAHRADDIMTAIRITNEFNVNMVLVHAYEAYKVAKYLKKYKIPVVFGSIWSARWQVETANLNMATPKILVDEGVKIALTTTHPNQPIYLLPMCAALAVREGLSMQEALKSITINAAEIMGLSNRIGSLETGKDADIVIMDNHPLQLMSKVEYTLINGEIVYKA